MRFSRLLVVLTLWALPCAADDINIPGILTSGGTLTGPINFATGSFAAPFFTLASTEALFISPAPSYTVSIGAGACGALTSGVLNNCMGLSAGGNITTGNNNEAIGALALDSIDTDSGNVAVGANALNHQAAGGIASINTALGNAAGYNFTTGLYNTFIGGFAGSNVTTGSNNTIIGANQNGAASMIGHILIGTGDGVTRLDWNDTNANQWTLTGTLDVVGNYYMNGLLLSSDVLPTINSCPGSTTNGAITYASGPQAFTITIGTGTITNSCSVTLPAAPHAWNCYATDENAPTATEFITKQSAWSSTGATFVNYTTAALNTTAWAAGAVLSVSCWPN